MRAVYLVGACLMVTGCSGPVDLAPTAHVKIAEPQVPMTTNFAVPVLMYHRVCDLTPQEEKSRFMRDLTVSPADFEEQVKFLKEEGFTFLLATDVADALRMGKSLPVKAVAITLDDGYRDNFTEALPILKKYGAKATVFMVTNNFGKAERLSWANVWEMSHSKVAFESHTVSHPDLRRVGDDQLWDELVKSRQILEVGLGKSVTSLAYPAGEFDNRVVAMAERTGYLSAWKKGGGPVRPGDAAEPYLLPRIRVHGRTDLEKFRTRVMSGVYILDEERRDS